MKRTFAALLLSLLLLMGLALAEDDMPLYRVYVNTGTIEALIGSAIPVSRVDTATALLAGGYVPEGTKVFIEGPDGRWAVDSTYRINAGGALILITEPEAGEEADALYYADDLTPDWVVGLNADGEWIAADVTRYDLREEDDVPLLYVAVDEALMPGAVVLNANDTAIAVLTASAGEGEGLWIATLAETFSLALDRDEYTFVTAWEELPEDWTISEEASTYVQGFTVEEYHGFMLVDWEGCIPEELPEEAVWRVYVQDEANTYYTWYTSDFDETFDLMDGTPGHTFYIWLRLLPSAEADDNATLRAADAVRYTLPADEPMSRYDYSEERVWVTMASNVWPDDAEIPEQPVTLSGLEAGQRAYLQVTSHYTCEEEDEDVVTWSLTAPDGEYYTDIGYFYYMPGLDPDVWHLDLTSLIEQAEQFGNGRGEWTLDWYFEGAWVNRVTFTIE